MSSTVSQSEASFLHLHQLSLINLLFTYFSSVILFRFHTLSLYTDSQQASENDAAEIQVSFYLHPWSQLSGEQCRKNSQEIHQDDLLVREVMQDFVSVCCMV